MNTRMPGISIVAVTPGETAILRLPNNPIEEFDDVWPYLRSLPDGVTQWLQRQFAGEWGALRSMKTLARIIGSQSADERCHKIIARVIDDEDRHVNQIGDLLRFRAVEPAQIEEKDIIEDAAIFDEETWRESCAIVSRAESVRAGKARVLAKDECLPMDVRKAFASIIRDEAFHGRAFAYLAGRKTMNETEFKGDGQWCKILSAEVIRAEAWAKACEQR